MRIDDLNLTSVPAAEPGRAQETQRASREDVQQRAPAPESGGGDQVQLSSAMGSLSRAITAYGTEREDRVGALSAQYRDGSYQPNSIGASRGLISEALAAGNP
jgi:hypothetical protein